MEALKVLICDDSILIRKKMKDVLEKNGISSIFEAVDGEQAVEMYKSSCPDIVFMDIVMPKKSGVDALKEIKAFDQTAKIVIASSVGTQGNLKEAIEAGAYDFLQKPLTEESIIKVIKNLK